MHAWYLQQHHPLGGNNIVNSYTTAIVLVIKHSLVPPTDIIKSWTHILCLPSLVVLHGILFSVIIIKFIAIMDFTNLISCQGAT